jgi:formate dehydrogenase major subunit
VPGLGTSLGRGAATSFQEDLQNSDCVLIMGSNMAEAHPVGFRFPMKARERGATLIHVDPHFTRTSAMCQQYVPIRAGSDIAFLGGLINYVLQNDRWFREYVMAYTNAATIIGEKYGDTEDLDGVFCGFDAATKSYDQGSGCWAYEGESADKPKTAVPTEIKEMSYSQRLSSLKNPVPPTDMTLQHPRCVMNILRRHYARYTPEMVASTCGCTK